MIYRPSEWPFHNVSFYPVAPRLDDMLDPWPAEYPGGLRTHLIPGTVPDIGLKVYPLFQFPATHYYYLQTRLYGSTTIWVIQQAITSGSLIPNHS